MTQRERFEAWARKQGINIARFDRYRYADNDAKLTWEAWQAACPEGWQCVPEIANDEMTTILYDWSSEPDYAWKEMLSAAPKPGNV